MGGLRRLKRGRGRRVWPSDPVADPVARYLDQARQIRESLTQTLPTLDGLIACVQGEEEAPPEVRAALEYFRGLREALLPFTDAPPVRDPGGA